MSDGIERTNEIVLRSCLSCSKEPISRNQKGIVRRHYKDTIPDTGKQTEKMQLFQVRLKVYMRVLFSIIPIFEDTRGWHSLVSCHGWLFRDWAVAIYRRESNRVWAYIPFLSWLLFVFPSEDES